MRADFRIQFLDELLDLALHLLHFLAHVEDDLYARKVYAEVARQFEDYFQPLQVFVCIKARIAVATRRLQQSLAFVQSERLRMNLILFSYR